MRPGLKAIVKCQGGKIKRRKIKFPYVNKAGNLEKQENWWKTEKGINPKNTRHGKMSLEDVDRAYPPLKFFFKGDTTQGLSFSRRASFVSGFPLRPWKTKNTTREREADFDIVACQISVNFTVHNGVHGGFFFYLEMKKKKWNTMTFCSWWRGSLYWPFDQLYFKNISSFTCRP